MSAIGTVSQLIGRAIAVKADGSERVLSIGDEVQADELIRVSPDGSLEIKMESGEPVNLEGGQSWLATADTFQESDDFDTTEAIADVQSIQEAILAGADPTEVAEETAAGGEGEADGNEGSSFVQVIATREEVDPTAGFETIGFSTVLDEGAEEEFFDDVPKILGTTTVLLDEDDLVSEDALAAGFETLKTAFEAATGLTTSAADPQGLNDTAAGDDIPTGALTVLTGNLAVDFGANGAGDITFNAAGTQPGGISSGGVGVQYWISEDGHSLVAYTETEDSAEIIFTAQITDALTGEFLVALYGQLDHPDTTTEDNLILDLSFTIQDSDDDTAEGVLRLDIDDDSPVVSYTVAAVDEDDLGPFRFKEQFIDSEFGPSSFDFTEFMDEVGYFGFPFAIGNNDEEEGDDLPTFSPTAITGALNADFGADGPGSLSFNAPLTQPAGLTSGGDAIQYWVSEDGESLIAYAVRDFEGPGEDFVRGEDGSTGHVEVIFTASLDAESGEYTFALYGPVDHSDTSTEDNMLINLGYIITDNDGDSAQGRLTIDVDDDSPVIENMGEDSGEDYPQGEDFFVSQDVAGEDGGLEIIHDESAGEDYQNRIGDDDYNNDMFTWLFPEGEAPVDMLGVAVRPVEAGYFGYRGEGGFDEYYETGVRYDAGADGLKNLALTDAEGQNLSGQDSGLRTSDTGAPIYLYTVPVELLVGLTGGEIPEQFADMADNFVVGLTVPDLDLTDVDSLADLYDSPMEAVADLAFVVALLEDMGPGYFGGPFAADSHDDVIALLQLKAIEHPQSGATGEDHDDMVSIEDLIHITITDGDGDTATSEAITVSFDDDGPVIGEPESSVVDEEGLSGGNVGDSYASGDVAGEALIATGDLDIDWGADNDNVTGEDSGGDRVVAFDDQSAPEGLSSNGESVQYHISDDASVLTAYTGTHPSDLEGEEKAPYNTVFTVTLSDVDSGSYSFNLLANLDHPTADTEDDIDLTFAFTATDADGDTASSGFTVKVDDDAPVIGESSSENHNSSILLGARDGSADLSDWGVTPGALTGTVIMDGVTATVEFVDNDSNPNSQLRIYNNNANHIGGGSLADNDGQGINSGETLRVSFDQVMQQAEIGVDGLGNHFLPNAPQQAHATWVAYKDGVEVGRGEVDNPEGQNEGLAGLLEVFTISIEGGFDTIELGNNSNNSGSNYEVRYIQAQGKNVIDEEGLPQGNLGDSYPEGDAVGADLSASGDLNIIWGADDNNTGTANRSVEFTDIDELPDLTSNGVAVTYGLNTDGTVLTASAGDKAVFEVTLSDSGSGSFNFVLLGNVDHAVAGTEDDLELTFEFVAADSDGDTVKGGFSITVDDDAPVVNEQNEVVRLDDDVLGGNAGGRSDDVNSENTTGTLAHDFGADGAGSILLLDSNATPGFTYTLNNDSTVLTISQDSTGLDVLQVEITDTISGAYEVTQLAAIEHADDAANRENNLQLSVNYQVTDADGDSVNGRVDINVDDDTPVVSRNALIRLDDDALEGGNEGGRADNPDSINATGTLAHNYGADGAGTVLLLASHAKPGFTYELNDDQTVLTISQDDTAVLQVSLSDTASGNYEVTQLSAIEHADDAANRENNIQFRVDYQVTDSDGDTVNGRVNINVDDDTPVVEDDGVDTSEDTSITIDVLANDSVGADGAEITSFTQPANGSVVLNEDSTFTFTPAANLHGQETFTYTIADADGDTATATVTVNVDAVADLPTLVVSVGNETALESDENLIVNGSFEDVAGLDENGDPVDDMNLRDGIGGFYVKREEISGWKTTEGAPMEPHYTTHAGVGTTDGVNYMDIGATPGNTSITQELNLIAGAEYKLSFDYRDKAAMQESGQSGEDSGVMQVLWNGNVIATVQGNNRDAWESLSNIVLVGIAGTNTLTFAEVGDADDNWGIAIDNVELFHVPYQYDLTVTSALTDVDGSELLGDVAISSLPVGVTLDGSILTSDTPLSEEQINSITASVKATETSNSDEAETITNAKVEFADPSLNAAGETADLLIEGTSGGDVIIGGDGDDIIFGRAGDDSLTGGSGEDLFVWEGSDVVTIGDPAHDTVTDFNVAEDVLNLTDLLSDGSHTIEGIEDGNGDLQVNVKDSGGNVVQEIVLTDFAAGTDAAETLQTLLDNGSIDDGI